MSDIKECKALLTRYLIARIPLITVNTVERGRIMDVIKEIGNDVEALKQVYVHTLSKGIVDLKTNTVVNDNKTVYGAVDYMSEQMVKRQNLTMVFTETPDLSNDSQEARLFKDLVTLANETGGTIIIFTNSTIWNQLQRLGLIINVSMPDEEEMYGFLKEYIDSYRNYLEVVEWDDVDIREAASILAGVTKVEAENVIAALIANNKIVKEDMDEVRLAKNRLFSEISGLEKIDVSPSAADVGGLSGLRSWLDEKKQLLQQEKREMLRQKGLQPPRGILLVGVPGCGKSLSAKSIAANWKLPLYRLDFATVQGSYVGQSEQQLKEALATAENLSPCILWIDEIEKGLSGAGSSNDGGVSTRMVGQFLFWLQESKKMVFVVATANDVSMLPSELLRRGRFDELFFVDLPTVNERKDIISLYMKKYLSYTMTDELMDKVVEASEGFTGADLESTIRDLAYRHIANESFVINEDNILTAFHNVVPLSQTSPEKIEAIRTWGKERAVPASGLPIGSEKLSSNDGKARMRKVLI